MQSESNFMLCIKSQSTCIFSNLSVAQSEIGAILIIFVMLHFDFVNILYFFQLAVKR